MVRKQTRKKQQQKKKTKQTNNNNNDNNNNIKSETKENKDQTVINYVDLQTVSDKMLLMENIGGTQHLHKLYNGMEKQVKSLSRFRKCIIVFGMWKREKRRY
jgi:hypothetical protein